MPIDDENDKIIAEIDEQKQSLDYSHDRDPNYLPEEVRELRNYIFQVHATYEVSLNLIVSANCFKRDTPYGATILEYITFAQKVKLVEAIKPNFPKESALAINSLRNDFAHKQGKHLYDNFHDNKQMLKKYKSLNRYKDVLHKFWGNNMGYVSELV